MSTNHTHSRDEHIKKALDSMRDMSAKSILVRQIFAQRAGMHVTDAECVDYLRELGPLSSGELAKRTRLSKGAVTAMVGRLKKQGIVSTEVNKNDKRGVIVSVNYPSLRPIAADYMRLSNGVEALIRTFSDSEIQLITDFNTELATLYEDLSK